MASIADCLKKLKIDVKHEDSILRGIAATADEKESAYDAIYDAILKSNAERADVIDQIEKQGGTVPDNIARAKDERIIKLEKHLKDNGYDFTVEPASVRDLDDLDSTKKARKELAEKQAKLFKKKVVFVKANGPFRINGVMVPSIVDTIFVDIRTDKAFDSIMAHELSHWMEQEKPAVYKELVKSLKTVIINEADYAKKYGIEGATKAEITKEIVGDLMGDNFTEQLFWQKVAEANPKAFKDIAAAIIKWLKGVIVKAKANGMGSEQWVKDATKAQDIIAKAVAQYTESDAVPVSAESKPKFHKAFHGSPHDHNKFESSKIGTGEGAQAYGYGHYFAESKDVAEYYKEALEPSSEITNLRFGSVSLIKNEEYQDYSPRDSSPLQQAKALLSEDVLVREQDVLSAYDKDGIAGAKKVMLEIADDRIDTAKQEQPEIVGHLNVLKDRMQNDLRLDVKQYKGKLYEVELAPEQDEYLLWDKPLSEQSDKVKRLLQNELRKHITSRSTQNNFTDVMYDGEELGSFEDHKVPNVVQNVANHIPFSGEDLYKGYTEKQGSDKKASEYLHSLGIRGIKYLDGSSRAKGEGAYNYVIFDDKDVSITAKFSKAAVENTLIAQHNLTVRNLIHADRMGGLAAPSIAVTDKAHPLTGFGEITLLSTKDLVDPKNGTKIFGSDIYSPRYPSISYDFSGKPIKALNALLAKGVTATGDSEYYNDNLQNDPFRELTHSSAAMYTFLSDQGVEPELAYTKVKELPIDSLKPFADGTLDSFDMSKDEGFRKSVKDYWAEKFDGEILGNDELINLARAYSHDVIAYRDSKKNVGKIDRQGTNTKLFRQISDANLRNKFDEYLVDLVNKAEPKEKIFKGYTNAGNRQYMPHDIDTVIKILKKDLRGGENFKYGLGSIRAKYSPQFKSIEQIRKSKGMLMNSESFDQVKKEVQAGLDGLNESLASYGTFSGYDNVETMLSDAAKRGISGALKDNGFENVPDSIKVDIQTFLNKLKDMPTEYFEAKILRAVGLGEFSTAVIPDDSTPQVEAILKKNGIEDIRKYKSGDNEDRVKQINNVTHVMFSRAPLRRWMPVPRKPGWTEEKILRALKSRVWNKASGKSTVLKAIAEFDSAEEFADHIYYHGTGSSVSRSLVPSITMSEAEAERSGGGGYGERYWAISLSKSKEIASNFTAQSNYGTVYGVILRKGANVQTIPGIEDAAEIEDHVVQLWNEGVDAVDIGGGEQELAVLNPAAIMRYENGEGFAVFKKKKFEPLTTEQIEDIYKKSKEFAAKLKETPAAERKNLDVPEVMFSRAPKLYSKLEQALEAASDKVFSTGPQVKLWLQSNAGKLGIKKDEIYWSGIDNWLDAQGKVSKQQVVEFVRQNGAKVEDVTLGKITADKDRIDELHTQLVDILKSKRELDNKLEFGMITPQEYDDGVRSSINERRAIEDELDQSIPRETLPKHNNANLTLPGGTDYKELVVTVPTIEPHNADDSTHFGDTGQGKQIGWLRMDTRDGGLFIEELQSQRAQQGRSKGFDVVPPAPFVSDANNKATNAYITLLMKKALIEAVSNDHASVSWTTGDQQADRYDLSKQISRVNYSGTNLKAYDYDGNTVISETGVQEKDLPDYIGKEAAEKLIAQPKNGTLRSLDSIDLKVGGEWAQSMYGNEHGLNLQGKPSLISQAANDIFKHVGSGKVESINGQPGFYVTPEMKSKDLPLFSRIVVDGVERPTTNSEGKPINNPVNFWKWFGNSKVVDEQGRPRVVYHGSPKAGFSTFDEYEIGSNTVNATHGFYFTENRRNASTYSGSMDEAEFYDPEDDDQSAGVYSVYLKITDPYEMDFEGRNWDGSLEGEYDGHEGVPEIENSAKQMGMDGAIITNVSDEGRFGQGYNWGEITYIAFDPNQIKSAIGNNGDYSSTNNDIRFSFAGPKAETADKYALETAQQRIAAGDPDDTVRQETGWFKGVDGKWRFEINDSDAKLINPPIAESWPTYLTRAERNKYGKYASVSTMSSKEFKEYKQFLTDTEQKYNAMNAQHRRLSTLLDHPKLYAAYPQLRDYDVMFNQDMGKTASFDPLHKVIRIGDPSNIEAWKGVLLHEIQHGIQTIEGFASGGSVESARRVSADIVGAKLKEINSQIIELGKNRSALKGDEYAKNVTLHKSLVEERNRLEDSLEGLKYDMAPAANAYKRLAGEVEARNTQGRLGMSEAERKATAPSATQDIPDSDQIIVYNGTEMAYEPEKPTPPDESRLRRFQRMNIDNFNRFTVIKKWLAENGQTLSDKADVYGAEERYHSMAANQLEDFREQQRNPLIEKIQKAGYTLGDIEVFLKMQHAQEANAQIRKLGDNPDATAYGITDDESAEYLAEAPENLANLANEFRAITEQTKKLRLDAGILNTDITDAWEGAYKHYVPVKGEADSTRGVGKGLKTNFKSKRRLGHSLRDEHVIENILMDHERAILEVERNRVGKHLVMMAAEMQRPDILSIDQPEKRKMLKESTAYTVEANGVVQGVFKSREEAKMFKQFYAASMPKVAPSAIVINQTKDQRVIASASPMLAENEINVYMNGHAIRVQINDELLARAYTKMGVEQFSDIVAAGRMLNGYLSKVYTGYSPEFILVNIQRDFQAGIINLTGEQGFGMATKALTNYPRMFTDLLKYAATNGKSSTKWIDAYRKNGGNTGAAYLSDMERLGNEVNTEYASYQGVLSNLKQGDNANAARAAGRKVFNATLKWIYNLNQAGENAMRLAAFKAMIDSGRTANEASKVAKNITVNFNRKGERQWTGALYLFYNASIQGTAATAHALIKGKHKGQAWALAGSMAAVGYMMAASFGGGDEDDWDEINEYTKERNMLIKSGDGYVKVPVPYGYGFFWNLGRHMSEAQRTGELGAMPWHLATSAISEFTPFNEIVVGSDEEFRSDQVFMGLLPTAMKIVAQPTFNKQLFTGSELMPESQFDKSQPDRQKMFRSTKGTMYDTVAGWLDSAGIDVSPETLKYITRTGTGGAGSLVDTGISAAMLKVEGAELDTQEIPFVRKAYMELGIKDKRAAYYKVREEARTAAEEFNRARRDNDVAKMQDVLKDKKELIALDRYANKLAATIDAARDQQDAVRADKNLSVQEKRLKLKDMEATEAKFYDQYLDVFKTTRRP